MLQFLSRLALMRRARRAISIGEYQAAVEMLETLSRALPKNAVVWVNKSVALQGVGNYDEALEACDVAIAINPNIAMAHYNRGISNKFLGFIGEAIADQTRALSLDSNDPRFFGECGVVLVLNHDFTRAAECLTLAISLAPRDPFPRRYRGLAHFILGAFSAANADLRESIKLSPDIETMAFCFLASARLGKDASRHLKSDINSLKSATWPKAVLDLFLGTSTPEELMSTAQGATQKGEAHFYLGQWLLLNGRTDEALAAFRHAIQLCPAYFVEHAAALAELRRNSVAMA